MIQIIIHFDNDSLDFVLVLIATQDLQNTTWINWANTKKLNYYEWKQLIILVTGRNEENNKPRILSCIWTVLNMPLYASDFISTQHKFQSNSRYRPISWNSSIFIVFYHCYMVQKICKVIFHTTAGLSSSVFSDTLLFTCSISIIISYI